MSDAPERLTAAQIDQLTPLERNRYADLLRLGSVAVVVLGHWLVAVVLADDGGFEATTLLAAVPASQWLTWSFQVMPLFFFVGGYANAAAWRSAAANGLAWGDWVRRRSRRLLRPVLPLLALWVPLGAVLAALGVPGDLLQLGSQAAFIPAWFLSAYLAVVSAAPLTWAAHRRWGAAALVALVATATALDVAHRAGVPLIGWANFFFVWGALHQLGYFWYDGRLPQRPAAGLGIAVTGFAALAALVFVAGYPLSMVGVDGAERSNNSPPTVALVALGIAQVGLVVAARDATERWLARPRVWARTVMAGSVAMTVYLWHMTALVAVIALTHPTGLWPVSDTVDARWWLLRPLWLAMVAVALAGLVVVFGRFERAGSPRPRPGRIRAGVGVAAAVAGIGLLVTGGVHDPERTAGVPLSALGLLGLGLAALGVMRNHPPADPPVRRSGDRRGDDQDGGGQ